MAETIDSLLISLGLQTDAKSFQKAEDAVKGLKDTILQLGSAVGVGLGTKALTFGVSNATLEIKRLSDITGLTTRQIDALRTGMVRLGKTPDEGFSVVNKIAEWQNRAKTHSFNQSVYMNKDFSVNHFSGLLEGNPWEAFRYASEVYQKSTPLNRQFLREGLSLGAGDTTTRIMESGAGWLDKSAEIENKYGKGVTERDVAAAEIFNDELSKLYSNFTALSRTLSSDLLPLVNALLQNINSFMKEHPEASKYIATGAMLAGSAATLGLMKKILVKGTEKGAKAGVGGASAAGAAGFLTGGVVAASAAYLSEPYIDEVLNSLLGEHDYFQRVRTAQTWADFGNALVGKGDARWVGGRWVDNRVEMPQRQFPQGGEQALFARLEQQHGIPTGWLNRMWLTESGGGKNMQSSAGALGHFQFMPQTGREWGLNTRDDFFDLEKSATAAARYSAHLLKRYNGDPRMAAAAYNWGMGNLDKYGLARAPKETRDYIPKVAGPEAGDFVSGMYQRPNFGEARPAPTEVTHQPPVVHQTNNVTINGVLSDEIVDQINDVVGKNTRQVYQFFDSKDY